ncbi:hypothetical protein PFISCL1PPCAC_20064, partial [Pristionchus fissidentatus]
VMRSRRLLSTRRKRMPIKGSNTAEKKISSLDKLKQLSQRGTIDIAHEEQIQEMCKHLILTDSQLEEVMVAMENSMEKGLAKETASTAAVRMLPSFVRAVPNGTEVGDFLALDLGGTNFRVLLIRLDGKQCKMEGKIFRVPETIMKGSGAALFDHIADCMAKFMEEHDLKDAKQLPLGFTFSFPCRQEGLTSAKLISWTKGFNASGVENEDVVQLLREACQRRGDIDIDVVAVLNDTVGALMSCAFNENSCQIGVIVGTGTNACYMEKIERCSKLDGIVDVNDGAPDEMIINTEWGAFGDDGAMDSIRTPFDEQVDRASINPGKQLFEKMISGMYMGEVVRVVLEALAREQLLFNGEYEAISAPGCFPTKYVSEIESDMMEDEDQTFQKTYQILEDIGIENVSAIDCANVAYVCSLVSTRAAHMTAAGIAMLLNRMNKKYVTVGVDGSVYRFHPSFPKLLDEKIDQLIKGDLEFALMLSEDGSGRGAALVAAVANRVKRERNEQ